MFGIAIFVNNQWIVAETGWRLDARKAANRMMAVQALCRESGYADLNLPAGEYNVAYFPQAGRGRLRQGQIITL